MKIKCLLACLCLAIPFGAATASSQSCQGGWTYQSGSCGTMQGGYGAAGYKSPSSGSCCCSNQQCSGWCKGFISYYHPYEKGKAITLSQCQQKAGSWTTPHP